MGGGPISRKIALRNTWMAPYDQIKKIIWFLKMATTRLKMNCDWKKIILVYLDHY